MGDKEDPSERHREIQKDPWEIKMTRGRKSGRSGGGTCKTDTERFMGDLN
jgi:hypothetical protein